MTREVIYLWTFPKYPTIASRSIRWRLGTPYSHVAIAVYIRRLDDYRVYQASNGDINTVLLENFLKHNHVIKSCTDSMNEESYTKTIRYMERQTGKKYGVMTALAATFEFARKMGIGNDDDTRFICSEYAFRTRQQYKELCPKHNVDSDYVEPKMLEEIMLEDGLDIKDGLNLSVDLAYL